MPPSRRRARTSSPCPVAARATLSLELLWHSSLSPAPWWLLLVEERTWQRNPLTSLPPGPAYQGPARAATRALCGDCFILQHPGAGSQGGAAGTRVFLLTRDDVSRELRLITDHSSVLLLALPSESPQSIPRHTAVLSPQRTSLTPSSTPGGC